MSKPTCFLAQFSTVKCFGPLQRAHLVKQQTIRREVWNRRADVIEARIQLGYDPFPSTLYDLLWDERIWEWACELHHDALDRTRKLKIPRERLPASAESYCADYGLRWWLDREYGALDGDSATPTAEVGNL